MAITDNLLEQAITAIVSVRGIKFNPEEIVEDVVSVATVFDDPNEFLLAITQIVHSLHLIVARRQIGQVLTSNLQGWWSFHFQSRKVNGHPADLRIVYQVQNTDIFIKGLGHRHLPQDVYQKLYNR